jgi:capsule synthesis protein PGA_cap
MLGREVARRLSAGDPAGVWSQELRSLCGSCDAVVCNLECCVSAGGERTGRIPGKPFFFRAPPAATEALAAIGTTAVGMANNHALDFGPDALADSLRHLGTAGIAAAGAGLDRDGARRGALISAGDLRVGLLAVSDHPDVFAAAPGSPGIAYAPLREGLPDWLLEELARLRDEADLVVAFPHWGPNMASAPARWQRRRAADLVGAGADLVAGHSAHVFHGIGRDAGRPVLFDLGDALDDYAVDERLRNDLGVLVLWRPRSEPELELVGLRLHFCHTELARGGDADWIADRLGRACAELGTRVERVAEDRLLVGG